MSIVAGSFAPSKMTVEQRQRFMASPTYLPKVDLEAAAGDEALAAFTILWYDAANKTELFEPVGTQPDHQRRDVSRAMGLRRLAANGATRAPVATRSDNVAAIVLWAGIEFELVDENIAWTKTLS
jgi:hypothetical protein